MKQAQRERDTGYKPPLKSGVPDLSIYSAVLLGFPIWGMSAPPVIKSFLSGHDLSGKPSIHAHGVGCDHTFAAVGGHLLALEVGTGSLEITITAHSRKLERKLEANIGANVLRI
ncbi:flavodoxin [Phyllobacterium sp. P5_D12]